MLCDYIPSHTKWELLGKHASLPTWAGMLAARQKTRARPLWSHRLHTQKQRLALWLRAEWRRLLFTFFQISDHVGLLAGEATGETHLHRAGGKTRRSAAGQRATGDKLTRITMSV